MISRDILERTDIFIPSDLRIIAFVQHIDRLSICPFFVSLKSSSSSWYALFLPLSLSFSSLYLSLPLSFSSLYLSLPLSFSLSLSIAFTYGFCKLLVASKKYENRTLIFISLSINAYFRVKLFRK